MDDLDAAGSIYTLRTRLRALSGVTRVVVRVHSGALISLHLGDMFYSVGACRIGRWDHGFALGCEADRDTALSGTQDGWCPPLPGEPPALGDEQDDVRGIRGGV